MADNAELWAKLSETFKPEDIELLPKYTGKKEDKGKDKRSCPECGKYHDFPCVHLHYVGHAGITTRINSVDPSWSWEPMGRTDSGLPALDCHGGLWAYLTILGVTKPAYGDPGVDWKGNVKNSPDGMKEAIGDMLRNGAMRFGVGTYLWSKSDSAKYQLEGDDDATPPKPAAPQDEPKASEAQVKCIFAVARNIGWTTDKLMESLAAKYGEDTHPADLTKAQAKHVIDGMKKLEEQQKAEKAKEAAK